MLMSLLLQSQRKNTTDVVALLDYFYKKRHKASLEKAQIAQQEVMYVGQKISHGRREIPQDRTTVIRGAQEPTTVRELRSFLGLCNFNRAWVESYSEIAQPLNDLKDQRDSRVSITMEPRQREAFTSLKRALCEASALGIPNTEMPFTLYVREVLSQEHGGLQRPVGYYSAKLDNVALGFGSCLEKLLGLPSAIQAVSSLVLDQQLVIKCPHSVHTLLVMRRATQVSASRKLAGYQRLQTSLFRRLPSPIHQP